MPIGNLQTGVGEDSSRSSLYGRLRLYNSTEGKMSSSFKRKLMKSCASAHGSPWAALAVAGVLSAIAPPSFAADKPVAAPSDSLEEIVVTAQFRQEKLQNVPIAITALSSESMDSRN